MAVGRGGHVVTFDAHKGMKLDNLRVNIVSRLDILSLKLIVALAEERSVAKAGERENIAPSAVSKRLTDIEHAIHAQLFVRARTGLEPTEAGKVFLVHCRKLLRGISEMESDILQHASGLHGHVRLLANESALFGYLPERLAMFGEKYPNVRVDLQAAMSPDIVDAMLERAADIGLFAGAIPTGDLDVRPGPTDKIVIIVAPSHPLAGQSSVPFDDVIQYDIIQQEPKSSIQRSLVRAFEDRGVELKSRFRVGGFDAVCRLVEAGLGIGFIPDLVARRLSQSVDMVRLELRETWATRHHWISSVPSDELSPAAKRLLAQLDGVLDI